MRKYFIIIVWRTEPFEMLLGVFYKLHLFFVDRKHNMTAKRSALYYTRIGYF